MQYLDSVLLSRWSYEAQGPTSALGGQKTLRTSSSASQPEGNYNMFVKYLSLADEQFGWEEAFRARSTRTPWQVNHIPIFFPGRPKMVPTKTQFPYRLAPEFLLSVLILDVMSLRGQGQDASMNSICFASSQVPFSTTSEYDGRGGDFATYGLYYALGSHHLPTAIHVRWCGYRGHRIGPWTD